MKAIKLSIWQILSATIASGLLVAIAPFEKNNSLLASIQFDAPGDVVPKTSVGGGVRGQIEFEAPGDATPNNSVSGGVRSDSSSEALPLLPPSKYGRTVSARPTFFVYLPQTNSKEIFFSLQDEQGESHYQTILKVSGKGGIVSVTLPKEAPELEIGKNYLWFFAPLQADGILRPDNYVVTGWVRRVENKVGNLVDYSSPIEAAAALAKAGIWYDTLQILATALQQEPNNTVFVKEWKELLEQVGLAAIATQPIGENL